MRSIEFYQKHLDRVSRSFAFCIAKLDSPFREWTSLSYLLCRVLDTVEDSSWPDLKLRNSQYDELEGYLERLPAETQVAAWKSRFPRFNPRHGETASLPTPGRCSTISTPFPPPFATSSRKPSSA